MTFTLTWECAHVVHGALLLLGDANKQGLADHLGATRADVEALAERVWEIYAVRDVLEFDLPANDVDVLAKAIPTCLVLVHPGDVQSMMGCVVSDLEAAQVELLGALREAGWSPPT